MLEQGKRLPDQQPSRRSVVDYTGRLELSKNVWLTCRAFLVMRWRTEIYSTYIDNPISMEKEQTGTNVDKTAPWSIIC